MKIPHVLILLAFVFFGVVFFVIHQSGEESEVIPIGGSVESNQPVPESVLNGGQTAEEIETKTTQLDQEPAITTRAFTLDAFKFGYSMDEIRVKEGDTVTINLTNSDGLHDWRVDEFVAATETISTGGEASVTFVANQKGRFEYYCSVGNHRALGMVGTLIVE